MKTSEIHFTVELDDNNLPDKIYWEATDNPNEGISDTKAIHLSVWDHYHHSTLAIPLWAKDMEVNDMKRFYIEMMGSIADTVARATGDMVMAESIDDLCRSLVKKLQAETKQG